MLLKKIEASLKNDLANEICKKAENLFSEYAYAFHGEDSEEGSYLACNSVLGVLEDMEQENPDEYKKVLKEFNAQDNTDIVYELAALTEFEGLVEKADVYLAEAKAA